ncbi:hypothetical protein [Deinococcus ruber]|uniref:Uncharacterized protein n=1 Tax=Deinococcus ruber TaxID=1848197 RepID=A0A918C0G4_9DEIO|nr:hypothetical protein [Deinococcus ruber]GGQ98957.1 hypothetical protein GCM10008957_09330 [Deinococcus ruber]
MFRDLREMVPEAFTLDVLDDQYRFSYGKFWACSSVMDWMTLCQLAEQVVSNLQDFVADMTAEWWPVVGRKRLAYRTECVDGRPELLLVL